MKAFYTDKVAIVTGGAHGIGKCILDEKAKSKRGSHEICGGFSVIKSASQLKGIIKNLAKGDVRKAETYIRLGKPEPLSEDLAGYWSVRIDEKNLIVFRIADEII